MKSILFVALFIITINANLNEEMIKDANSKCEVNDAHYCDMLGKYYGDEFYLQNKSDKKFQELSIKYLTKACNLKNGDSCALLSEKYKYIFHNHEKGIEYALKGCDNNSGYACVIVATYYDKGYIKDEDGEKTEQIFNKACRLGYDYACKSNKKVIDKINNAILKCGSSAGKECYNAAVLYKREFALSKYTNLDYEIQAREFAKMGCDNGYGDSCALAGMSYRTNLSNSHTLYLSDDKMASKYLKKGCSQLQSSASCDALAIQYDDTYKATKKKEYRNKAIIYFNKACNLGNKRSCSSVKQIKRSEE